MKRFIVTIVFIISGNQVLAQQIFPFGYEKPRQLPDGIKTGLLKEAGLNPQIIDALTDSITKGIYTNIHSVLILRNNKLVYEQYWPGKDFVRWKQLGIVNHHRDSLHDVRSVTKSVVSAAVMIAIAQKKIKSEKQRVFDYFPEYSKYDTGLKRQITIKHLLNMSAGFEWNESLSYNDSLNSATQLENDSNPIKFVLRQTLADTPGSKFNYSGGCTQLLSAIVEKATGMDIEKFTAKHLFKPLGITNYKWTTGNNGVLSAGAGLRMRSRDLLKFGMLYLNNGKWKGKQIIPSQLVAQSFISGVFVPYSSNELRIGYSNQFWIYSETIEGRPVTYIQAQGNGGQIIVIDKQTDLVVVLTAGNYGQGSLRKSSWNIYYDFVYPSILKKEK